MSGFVSKFGILRILLMLSAALMVVGGVIAGLVPDDFDWDTMPVALGPAFAPIVFTVILFDIVMSRVVMSADERRERYGTVLWTYVGLLLAVAIAWGPFYAQLF